MLALGWQGTPRQWQRLEMAMHIMAIVIIPVAVSVHTIVSWDFAMTPVPMWHSTIFGPYFVAGAIFSGIAALDPGDGAAAQSSCTWRSICKPIHFENLGKLLLTMSLLWFYFTFAERLTTWYGNSPSEMAVFWETHSPAVRAAVLDDGVCNFIIPVPILAIKRLRTITGTAIASCTVVVGMWLERFLIMVPALEHKFLPYSWGTYRPTWVEDTLMASSFGFMALLYLLFSKFVPMISIWEMKVGLQPHGGVPITAAAEDKHHGIGAGRAAAHGRDGMKALYALYADPGSRTARGRFLARRQLRAQVRRAANRHRLRRASRGLRIYRRARHRRSLPLGGARRRRRRHLWLFADHALAEVLSDCHRRHVAYAARGPTASSSTK